MNYKGNIYILLHIKIKEYKSMHIKKWVPQNVAPLKQSP